MRIMLARKFCAMQTGGSHIRTWRCGFSRFGAFAGQGRACRLSGGCVLLSGIFTTPQPTQKERPDRPFCTKKGSSIFPALLSRHSHGLKDAFFGANFYGPVACRTACSTFSSAHPPVSPNFLLSHTFQERKPAIFCRFAYILITHQLLLTTFSRHCIAYKISY